MKNTVPLIRRFAVTILMVVAAVAVGRYLWVYYMDAPWTPRRPGPRRRGDHRAGCLRLCH